MNRCGILGKNVRTRFNFVYLYKYFFRWLTKFVYYMETRLINVWMEIMEAVGWIFYICSYYNMGWVDVKFFSFAYNLCDNILFCCIQGLFFCHVNLFGSFFFSRNILIFCICTKQKKYMYTTYTVASVILSLLCIEKRRTTKWKMIGTGSVSPTAL